MKRSATDYAVKLAMTALDINAIQLSPEKPFQWASGYFMPVYNDNRLFLRRAGPRRLVADTFEQLVRSRKLAYDLIAGVPTAGIAHAVMLAERLGTDFCYIREKRKDHGMRNRIEGIGVNETLEGKVVLPVEDLVSTGGSSLKAAMAARNAGARVDDMLAIFSYQLPEAVQQFEDAEIRLHAGFTYATLLEVAKRRGRFGKAELAMLEEWSKDQFGWGAKHGFPRGETKTFAQKWREAVARKDSVLCAGLDPAENGQRDDNVLPYGTDKFKWCMDFVDEVAPFAAAVKPNRNYIKDFSREQTEALVKRIHDRGMVAIDDSKLVDIGDTNESGIYHAAEEGFDAVTFAPFPGNTAEAVAQSKARGLGLIPLVLMSNAQFEPIKNSTIRGFRGFEYFAFQVAEYGADAVVIGAPSPTNHIKDEEVRRARAIIGDKLVLMPGVGAQGGDAKYIIEVFGADNVIGNVSRELDYARRPAKKAKQYRDMLNRLRKRA